MLKIIEIWFENYKHTGQVIIQGYDDTLKALDIIKSSQKPYEVLERILDGEKLMENQSEDLAYIKNFFLNDAVEISLQNFFMAILLSTILAL